MYGHGEDKKVKAAFYKCGGSGTEISETLGEPLGRGHCK